MNVEKILKEAHDGGVIDYRARVIINDGRVEFYMHPSDVDGETLDFVVSGSRVYEKTKYLSVMEAGRHANNA